LLIDTTLSQSSGSGYYSISFFVSLKRACRVSFAGTSRQPSIGSRARARATPPILLPLFASLKAAQARITNSIASMNIMHTVLPLAATFESCTVPSPHPPHSLILMITLTPTPSSASSVVSGFNLTTNPPHGSENHSANLKSPGRGEKPIDMFSNIERRYRCQRLPLVSLDL
jgi:hypothetical protein